MTVSDKHPVDPKVPPVRPYWLPDLQLDTLPDELRLAVQAILNPAYEQLVLRATNELERATANTVVYLLGLELLSQLTLTEQLASADPLAAREEFLKKHLPQHLRLIASKLRFSQFLQRLRKGQVRPAAPTAPLFQVDEETSHLLDHL